MILERIATTISATADLLEAEGRLVRIKLARAGAAGLAFAACAFVAALGLLSAATGAIWLLAQVIGTPLALVVGGCVIASVALAGARLAYGAASGVRRSAPSPREARDELALRADAA